MASQLAGDIRSQRLMHCAASYGERGSRCSSLAHHQSYIYHRIQPEGNSKEHNMGHEKDVKRSTKRGRQQAQKLHRLGFSYLASSFLYLVIKVKAFYNGFLGDVAGEPKIGIEAPMTNEPYFSVPVLPN
ncbi:uncharacterized protein LOC113869921 [Abrus precatorius]|uniref:Uncharacterized protein LOC113869921 n=1 Tax=Abrus precatorius TaxID=3816 RepID=A0A8B8M3I7_ABRPR|nr:uncharacterized protein LOC113869921 [Abrus precatorius]